MHAINYRIPKTQEGNSTNLYLIRYVKLQFDKGAGCKFLCIINE